MNKLLYSFLGFVLGCMVTYTILPRKHLTVVLKSPRRVHHVIKDIAITSHVTLTCYQPLVSQCDNDPLTTSDGSKINLKHLKGGKIKWCAISQDLLYLFPKDKPKRIFVEGYGIYEVKDVMNRRHKHKVDLLIHPKNSMRINIENVKIKILL